jgi:hypothetical protein
MRSNRGEHVGRFDMRLNSRKGEVKLPPAHTVLDGTLAVIRALPQPVILRLFLGNDGAAIARPA